MDALLAPLSGGAIASSIPPQMAPASVRYRGAHDRTYTAFQSNLGISVNYYDHDTGSAGTVVKIATQPGNDMHGAPAIHVFTQGAMAGRILVVHSYHGSPMYARVSKSAESIGTSAADWDTYTVDGGNCDYPGLFERSDGTVILFYRRETNTATYLTSEVFKTTANGAAWSALTELIRAQAQDVVAYCARAAYGDEIHVTWYTTHWDTSYSWDAHHIWTGDGGATWKQADGSSLSLPVNDSTATSIIDSAGAYSDYTWNGSTSEPSWSGTGANDACYSLAVYGPGDAALMAQVGSAMKYCRLLDGVWTVVTTDLEAYRSILHPTDEHYAVKEGRLYERNADGTAWTNLGYVNSLVTATYISGYHSWTDWVRDTTMRSAYVTHIDNYAYNGSTWAFSAGDMYLASVPLAAPLFVDFPVIGIAEQEVANVVDFPVVGIAEDEPVVLGPEAAPLSPNTIGRQLRRRPPTRPPK